MLFFWILKCYLDENQCPDDYYRRLLPGDGVPTDYKQLDAQFKGILCASFKRAVDNNAGRLPGYLNGSSL